MKNTGRALMIALSVAGLAACTYSFADGDDVYDGICEVCHTRTAYHRSDGSGARHHDRAACTRCPSHANAFGHLSDSWVAGGQDDRNGHWAAALEPSDSRSGGLEMAVGGASSARRGTAGQYAAPDGDGGTVSDPEAVSGSLDLSPLGGRRRHGPNLARGMGHPARPRAQR